MFFVLAGKKERKTESSRSHQLKSPSAWAFAGVKRGFCLYSLSLSRSLFLPCYFWVNLSLRPNSFLSLSQQHRLSLFSLSPLFHSFYRSLSLPPSSLLLSHSHAPSLSFSTLFAARHTSLTSHTDVDDAADDADAHLRRGSSSLLPGFISSFCTISYFCQTKPNRGRGKARKNIEIKCCGSWRWSTFFKGSLTFFTTTWNAALFCCCKSCTMRRHSTVPDFLLSVGQKRMFWKQARRRFFFRSRRRQNFPNFASMSMSTSSSLSLSLSSSSLSTSKRPLFLFLKQEILSMKLSDNYSLTWPSCSSSGPSPRCRMSALRAMVRIPG